MIQLCIYNTYTYTYTYSGPSLLKSGRVTQKNPSGLFLTDCFYTNWNEFSPSTSSPLRLFVKGSSSWWLLVFNLWTWGLVTENLSRPFLYHSVNEEQGGWGEVILFLFCLWNKFTNPVKTFTKFTVHVSHPPRPMHVYTHTLSLSLCCGKVLGAINAHGIFINSPEKF